MARSHKHQQRAPTRDAYLRDARQLLLDASRRNAHYLLIVDDTSAKDRAEFIQDLAGQRSDHVLMLHGRNAAVDDPVRDAIASAIWSSVEFDEDVDRLHGAITRNVPRGAAPSRSELLPLLRGDGDDALAPVGFVSVLPSDVGPMIDVLGSVARTVSWWIFVDGVALESTAIESAVRLVTLAAKGLKLSIVLGTTLTREAWSRADVLQKASPEGVAIFPLPPVSEPTTHARPPVVRFMIDYKEAREAEGDRRFWNDHVIAAILSLIWALGRIHDRQVGEIADVFDVETPELRELLEKFEHVRHDEGDFSFQRDPELTSNKQAEAEVLAIVEKLVTGVEWHRSTARSLLKNLPRRGGKVPWHEDTGRFFHALLTTAYRYVQFRKPGDAEAMFERARVFDDTSDTRFALLYELFRDSQHLSVIDYALALMSAREEESSFAEMRMFRQACHEAQRYRDRYIYQQLTELAPRDRIRNWVLPDELAEITRGEEWIGTSDDWQGALRGWLAPFDERMREFRITSRAVYGMARVPIDFGGDAPAHVTSSPSARRVRKTERARQHDG